MKQGDSSAGRRSTSISMSPRSRRASGVCSISRRMTRSRSCCRRNSCVAASAGVTDCARTGAATNAATPTIAISPPGPLRQRACCACCCSLPSALIPAPLVRTFVGVVVIGCRAVYTIGIRNRHGRPKGLVHSDMTVMPNGIKALRRICGRRHTNRATGIRLVAGNLSPIAARLRCVSAPSADEPVL